MPLFNKNDLIAYRERIDLQLSILPISPVLTETEKNEVAIIYSQLIAICDKAIDRLILEIEVNHYTTFLAIN